MITQSTENEKNNTTNFPYKFFFSYSIYSYSAQKISPELSFPLPLFLIVCLTMRIDVPQLNKPDLHWRIFFIFLLDALRKEKKSSCKWMKRLREGNGNNMSPTQASTKQIKLPTMPYRRWFLILFPPRTSNGPRCCERENRRKKSWPHLIFGFSRV